MSTVNLYDKTMAELDENRDELYALTKDLVSAFAPDKDEPPEDILASKLKEKLPNMKDEEAKKEAKEIVDTVLRIEEKRESLKQATSMGRSRESWLASELKESLKDYSVAEKMDYLRTLDETLEKANAEMAKTILNKNGDINMNPQLHGYIAEQHHAQTFNMKAAAKGSEYRGNTVEPKDGVYGKNSVDIVVKDKTGKVVRRYQQKYYKDAKATEEAFKHGDYRGQQKLVPKDQKAKIKGKVTDVIESPDGVQSQGLTKKRAIQLQKRAQKGEKIEFDYNDYDIKDLSLGVGRQAAGATVMGAALGGTAHVIDKFIHDEKIEVDEVVVAAIKSGADNGVKVATAGALKVGAEKGIIKAFAKNTSASVYAMVATSAVDSIKLATKVANGELSAMEGLSAAADTTAATIGAIEGAGQGAAAGAAALSVFGPVGAAVGGFIGGTVGSMMGSTVGRTISKGVKKVAKVATSAVKSVAKGVYNFGASVASGICSIGSAIGGFFSRVFDW